MGHRTTSARDAWDLLRSTGEGLRQLLFLVAALPILSQQQRRTRSRTDLFSFVENDLKIS